MERNPIEQTPSPEREHHAAKVTLFRHGFANYEQGSVPIEEAADLTDEGREKVQEQAQRLVAELESDEEITIWSSPMGRTLETATILADTLRDAGFNIRLKKQADEVELPTTAENSIRVFQTLEEVRGLNIEMFSTLVDGGSYILDDGTKAVFDKATTNPNDLPFQEYYYQQGYKDYLEHEENIPEEIRKSLESLEDEGDVHHRFDRKIDRVSQVQSGKKQRVIIVTHHVCMKDHTEDVVQPADYVNLD